MTMSLVYYFFGTQCNVPSGGLYIYNLWPAVNFMIQLHHKTCEINGMWRLVILKYVDLDFYTSKTSD